MTEDRWLLEFAALAAKTDKFKDKSEPGGAPGCGLIGEARSIVSELKKKRREREADTVYRERMVEEIGDFLWYFVRLAAVVTPGLLEELPVPGKVVPPATNGPRLTGRLDFGAAGGEVLAAVSTSKSDEMWTRLGTAGAGGERAVRFRGST